MEIKDEQRDGVTVVSLSGRLDTNTSGELEKQLLGMLKSGTRLVVDMGGTVSGTVTLRSGDTGTHASELHRVVELCASNGRDT